MEWLAVIVLCGPLGCSELRAAVASEAACLDLIGNARTVVQAAVDTGGGGPIASVGRCEWTPPARPDLPAPPPLPPGEVRT